MPDYINQETDESSELPPIPKYLKVVAYGGLTLAIATLLGLHFGLLPSHADVINPRNVHTYVTSPIVQIDAPVGVENLAVAERLPSRIIIMGDSGISLWQDELAAEISAAGKFNGHLVSEVYAFAQEGKLPCFFDVSNVGPGDVVIMSFAATRWHREENEECAPHNAPAMFYKWLNTMTATITINGGTIIPIAPPRDLTDMNFGNEPWWDDLHPTDILDRLTVFGPALGAECRKVEILREDKYHTAPEGEAAFAKCLVDESNK
jgi:hypothetical protein